MVAPIHNIMLTIYKDIHRERTNIYVFGLYLTEIEISLLFFSLLFQEKWIWVYIFLGLFVCNGGLFVCYGGLMAISNREKRWTDLVWGKVDRFWGFWVSSTDLGGSKGHV